MQTQLQVMSSYSLLQSPIKLPELVKKAKESGYSSLALTDLNNLYGSIDFYKICNEQGIKPIIGLTINTKGLVDSENDYPLILLAKSSSGYHNLIKISSKIMSSQESLDLMSLKDFFQGLFFITPATKAEVLATDKYQEYLQLLKEKTDAESVYLGVGLADTQINNVRQARDISAETYTPLVALSDVRYLNPDDHL